MKVLACRCGLVCAFAIALAVAPADAHARRTMIRGSQLAHHLLAGVPISENGLVELSYAIRELRQLTSNLNIIATKIERDPANFLFTGKQGYKPK